MRRVLESEYNGVLCLWFCDIGNDVSTPIEVVKSIKVLIVFQYKSIQYPHLMVSKVPKLLEKNSISGW